MSHNVLHLGKKILLVWDDHNVQHIGKHDVLPSDVEMIFEDKHVVLSESYKGRFIVSGKVGTRMLSAVIAPEAESMYYLVTARDASKEERRFYRNAKKEKQNSRI